MQYRRLGAKGPRVSAVGFGAWAIGGNAHGNSYGPTDDAESVHAVKRAIDLGCNFFDTADVYGWGHSEELLGRALEGRRDDVLIATKAGGDFYHGGVRMNFAADYLEFAVKESLKRLRTKHLDLFQLHNPPPSLVGDAALYEKLEQLKAAGSIREYGVSIHQSMEGLAAMEAANIASLQVVYNLLAREPETDLFPTAKRKGVGIIAREPLGNGFLTGKFRGTESFAEGDIRHNWPPQVRRLRADLTNELRFLATPGRSLAQAAIAFGLLQDAVSTVIPGCKTVAQVEENLAAADVRFTPEERRRLEAMVSSEAS